MADIIKLAFTSLMQHKLRAFLTTLGITIGVFTVGTVTAIIEGLNTSFKNQISILGSDVFYVSKYNWFGNYEDWIQALKFPPIEFEAAEYVISRSEYLDVASPMMDRRADLKFRDQIIEDADISGVNENMPVIEGTEIVSGRFISPLDVTHRKNVVVIGENVREKFFPQDPPVGQTIRINAQKYRVIGLFEKKGDILGYSMDNRVQIPFTTHMKYFKLRSHETTIAFKAGDPDQVDQAREELLTLMRRQRQLRPEAEDNFYINQMDAILELYRNMTAMLWAVAIGIGSISLVVGGIGVMNIMLVTVVERTREIGIRKSIGATRAKILFQFLIESMVVCAIGVVTGLCLAAAVSMIIQHNTPLAARIPANWAFLGAGTVIVVGLIFGLWPARRAAKMDPIEALRS